MYACGVIEKVVISFADVPTGKVVTRFQHESHSEKSVPV
jgi:hypothetical protein